MKVAFGSFLAVLAGWIAGSLCMGPLAPFAFFFMGGYVLPVWLFICLPLYALVPLRSLLWRPEICTILGAIAGGGIVVAVGAITAAQQGQPYTDFALGDAMGVITGSVACLTASLTVRSFRDDETRKEGNVR